MWKIKERSLGTKEVGKDTVLFKTFCYLQVQDQEQNMLYDTEVSECGQSKRVDGRKAKVMELISTNNKDKDCTNVCYSHPKLKQELALAG